MVTVVCTEKEAGTTSPGESFENKDVSSEMYKWNGSRLYLSFVGRYRYSMAFQTQFLIHYTML